MCNQKISETAFLWATDPEVERVYTTTFNGRRFHAATRQELAVKLDKYLRDRNLVRDSKRSTSEIGD
jgi:hypothetical protein